MLLLKKHLVELVRAGKKRQTVRFWSRPIVRVGQISFTPGLGKMLITRVEELTGFDQLTHADALADGFPTRDELLAELKRHYPQTPPGKRLYRVVFEWPLKMAETGSLATAKVPTSGEFPAAKNLVADKVTTSRVEPEPPRLVSCPQTMRVAAAKSSSVVMDVRLRIALRDYIQRQAIAAGIVHGGS